MDSMKKYPRGWIFTSGSMKLAPNEFLVQCPYDSNHKVLHQRFNAHLRRCRTNYELHKAGKGESPLSVHCRYNAGHSVYSPELIYHEHNCTDKMLPALENIYSENKNILEEICGLNKQDVNEKKPNGYQNGAVSNRKNGVEANEKNGAVANGKHGSFSNSSNGTTASGSNGATANRENDVILSDEKNATPIKDGTSAYKFRQMEGVMWEGGNEVTPAQIISKLLIEMDTPILGNTWLSLSELEEQANRLIKMVKDRWCPTVVETTPVDLKSGQKNGTIRTDAETELNLISQTLDPDCWLYGSTRRSDQYEVEDLNMISQTMDPSSFGYNRRRQMLHEREVAVMKQTNDSATVTQSKPKKFDWLELQYNLKGPLRIYPPGLTKKQRKEFEIANTERLKCEEGIFDEEDEAPKGKESKN